MSDEEVLTPKEFLASLLADVQANPMKAAGVMGRVLARVAKMSSSQRMTQEDFLAIVEEEREK